MSGTYKGRTRGGTCSTAKHGLIYVYMCVLKHYGPPADGGHPGGRRTGGRYTTDGHTCLRYGGKGGHGGSPNTEAGKMYQHTECYELHQANVTLALQRAVAVRRALFRLPAGADDE